MKEKKAQDDTRKDEERNVLTPEESDQMLQKSEEKYREIVENINDVLYSVDLKGTIIYVSPRVETVIGYTPEEVMNTPFPAYIHPEDQAIIQKAFGKILKGELAPSEYRIRAKNGQYRWIRTSSRPMYERGRIVGLQGVLADISEQKQAESILKESEARFRSLFELSPQAVALTDAETGRIVDANKKLCRLSGYTKEELIGNSTTGLGFYTEDKRRTFVEALHSSGEVRGMEMDFRVKNGDILKALIYVSTIEITGKPLILTVFHDVTTERQLEDQLRQAHKMEAIGTLTGGIAHDFNNILAIILGYSEIAENQVPGSSPVQNSLQEIKSAALRARDIVQQLLTFTRKGELKHRVIDIRPIVKEGLKMLRSTIPTTVEFRETIPDNSFSVKIDATQVHQILVNLCTNASHSMEAGGIMEVQLETVSLSREELDFDKRLHPGDYVKLSVKDTGQGIPEKDLYRIFDPYYTTKKVGNGSGLGLSVVMGLVKTHGGGIRVGSELGVGTTFEVFFPLAEPAAEASPIQGSPEIPRGSERILFVDDEQMIVDLNRQRLELLGYRVTACTSPLDALATIVRDAEGFDLVITDMTMPKMAGDRLIKEILGIRPSLPIILCTGYSERISAESARALGVSRYLKKPLEMQTLAVSVREALDK